MAGVKKNRKRKSDGLRKNRRSVLMISLVIMLLGAVVLGCGVSLKAKNEAYLAKEEELRLQIEAEQERSEEIDELKEYVETDEYIEMVAKEKLGLAYENEILFEAQK
ncbi:MAG: septum formation initiator family protein [bacterium]|nr:septum formation initiator family protein [bacterium]